MTTQALVKNKIVQTAQGFASHITHIVFACVTLYLHETLIFEAHTMDTEILSQSAVHLHLKFTTGTEALYAISWSSPIFTRM